VHTELWLIVLTCGACVLQLLDNRQPVLPVLPVPHVCQVVTVGLGSADNARSFAATLGFPLDSLYADPSGACYKALGFSPGFAPGALLQMLLGC